MFLHRMGALDAPSEIWNTDMANNVMELLPFTPAADLVTREDMHATRWPCAATWPSFEVT
jgi:hypothetical protein